MLRRVSERGVARGIATGLTQRRMRAGSIWFTADATDRDSDGWV